MKEPTIRIGFIIINPNWKSEVVWDNGHRNTAVKWIRNNHFEELYSSVQGTNNIYDEEDFLINYIGAIKLYSYRGTFYCYIPSGIHPDKSYLKHYFEGLGYTITGVYNSEEKEENIKIKKFNFPYNKTVIKMNNEYCYNPYREGD